MSSKSVIPIIKLDQSWKTERKRKEEFGKSKISPFGREDAFVSRKGERERVLENEKRSKKGGSLKCGSNVSLSGP